MKISLIGYMGSGKTSIGKLLNKHIGLEFIDLDDFIEKEEGLSVPEIFAQKGEIYFRKKEKTYLHQVLAKPNILLSTGGGTPAYYDNMDFIKQNSISFFLQANPLVLAKRLYKEKIKRPMISHIPEEDLPEFVAKHLFERNPFYHDAKYTVYSLDKSEQEMVEEILSLLKYHQSLS